MGKFRLTVEMDKSGVWFVTSPDIKGLLVAKKTLDEALRDTPRAMLELETVRSELSAVP